MDLSPEKLNPWIGRAFLFPWQIYILIKDFVCSGYRSAMSVQVRKALYFISCLCVEEILRRSV